MLIYLGTFAASVGIAAYGEHLRTKKNNEKGFYLCLALAVLVMAEVLLALNWGSPFDWAHQPALSRTLWLTAMVVMGVVVYFGMLYAQGFRLADFRRKEH